MISEQEKKRIFKEARQTSNALIAWNIPERRKLLPQGLQEESRNYLYEVNPLDNLIIKKLGNGGWNNEAGKKDLTDQDWEELKEATHREAVLIEKLELQAGRAGEYAKLLQTDAPTL